MSHPEREVRRIPVRGEGDKRRTVSIAQRTEPQLSECIVPPTPVETSSKMAQECDSPTWIWRALIPRSPFSDVVMSLGIVRVDPEPSPTCP